MTPDELQELCALYVLGALEPQATADLEARLRAGDPDVLREVRACHDVSTLLPYALPPLAPHPNVRAQLMARVQTTMTEAQVATSTNISQDFLARFRRPLLWLPAAAVAVLALVFGWFVSDLRRQVTDLGVRIQQLRGVAADHERLLTLLASSSVQIVTLTGTEHAPASGARLLWDTQHAAWTMIAHNLPPLPAGKAYQLWLLTPGAPIPSGTFHLDADRRGIIQTPLPTGRVDITGAAVSLEPEGGVSQPTGQIVLATTF
jgi:anti-sigma-K factor RskA